MLCEMCSSPNVVFRIELEGSQLNVCPDCAKYGRILTRVRKEEEVRASGKQREPVFVKETESVQLIRDDYSKLIKQAREKTGLTQKEFANRMMEKESVIHNLESGSMKPGIDLARKLERILKITLVEQVELEAPSRKDDDDDERPSGAGLTIGDLLKKRPQ
ncbi:TIGR00270 family protein [Candidatus Woesearchaeota archaeon]|nr:TIGR00270 family protein [Candidatus Woesearchaeota archaeon]